jgi:serine/threonine protein kinase
VTPDRWALLREIFGKALEAPESERSGVLDSACNGDPDLRSEVERLLAESEAPTWQPPGGLLPSLPELAAGETLAHFRIDTKLGEGGMGIVYRAYDTRLQRPVALKVLQPEYLADPSCRHRLIREARAASALNHPNIVTVYEIGAEDGVDFISMEYLEGRPLAESIPSRGLPLARVLDYAIAIAEALTHAHATDVIHRDLKPANVIVTADNRIKLLDFGLARRPHLLEAETITLSGKGVVAGTPAYMSPEQVRGWSLDPRTDIFSLGVVLYEMITGRRAFEGDTAAHTMISILEKDPIPVSHYIPQVPGELQDILRKALEKNREERYQVCKDLELDLKRLRQEFGTTPAPSSLGETSRVAADHILPQGRSRWKIATLAAVGLAAVAASGYLFSNRTPVLAERASVLLADFVNTTGEPVFDSALKAALAIQLQQSPFMSIFSEEQARDTLRFMGRQPDERITKAVGREICKRRGVKVLLAGSIGGIGSHYVITLEAIGALSGDVVAREQAEAESKERILHTLGGAATRLRRTLGESIGSIQRYDRPLETVTTSSLEALDAWSISRDLNRKGRYREAIPYARRAVELDPNFAMAYRNLGIYFYSIGPQTEREEIVRNLQRAFDLRERASEFEKLLIAGDYYRFVLRDSAQALETLQLLNQIYPPDQTARQELGVAYGDIGEFEKQIECIRGALQLLGPYFQGHGSLTGALIKLNRFAEAKQFAEQGVALYPQEPRFHNRLFTVAFVGRDATAMKQQIDWAAAQPGGRVHFTWLADAHAFQGQMKKSRQYARSAIREALSGECQKARELSAGVLTASGPGTDPAWEASLALGLCGDVARAQAATDAYAQAQPPTATIENGFRIPELRAAIALAQNQPAHAIELLEPAIPFRGAPLGWPQYLRGLAYLKLKSAPEAMSEFQYILDHRGLVALSQTYPLACLGLSRAAALAEDAAKSRRAYQDLFAIWNDADQELPVLIEAKSEYDRLPR